MEFNEIKLNNMVAELKCIESCDTYQELYDNYENGEYLKLFKSEEERENTFRNVQKYVVKKLEDKILDYLKQTM
ncbi:MAG: hypothetical protein IJH20_06545 [Bacilli bacterium]|nr:hypothetical protein [Bacilli bacterium]